MELKEIKELIRFFDKSDISELEIEEGETRLYLSKLSNINYGTPSQMPAVMSQPALTACAPAVVPADSPLPAKEQKGKLIESPIIGTYYTAPSPGADPFISVGDVVEKGQTLCIIEAMKIMNTIEAEFRCKILEILADNGKAVEYGQDLFLVEPM